MKKNTLKILIIEDVFADAEIIIHLLKKDGEDYEFKVVMNKVDYIKELNEFKPDIVLSDNEMPQFNATKALEILQSNQIDIPFILVTGTVSEEFAVNIIKAGADDYLLKDRLARLPLAITAALKQKQTERENKEAIERLKQSEEKYRSMMERVSDAVVALDKKGNYTYVNKQAANSVNLTPDDMVGKHISALYPQEVNLHFYNAFNEALEKQEYIVRENYYEEHDSWLENHIYPSPDGLSIFFRDITTRKKTEEKIKASEEKYRLITDQAFDGIVMYAADGTILDVNQSACVYTGYSQEELKKLNVTSLFFKEELAKRPLYFKSLKAGKATLDHRRIKKKDGSFIEMEIGTKMMHDGNFIATGRDITERKKAEQAVIKSEQRYQTLANVSPVGIFHTDETGYTTYVNPCWCQISGLRYEEAIGDGWLKAVHEEDKRRLETGWKEATRMKRNSVTEYRFVRSDGTVAWVLGKAIPQLNAENNIVGYVGTITDITERKKAEEEIKKSNERFELIAKATNDGLWDWNLETNQVWGNETHQQLYGLSIADRVPNYAEWQSRIHPEDREKTVNALEAAKASNCKVYFNEYRFYTENKGWVNIYGRTLIERNQDGKTVRLIGSMIDITDRKKAEEAIKASEEKYRALIEEASEGIFISDNSGRFITVNPSACKISQYTEDELLQMSIYDFFVADDVKESPLQFEALRKGQTVVSERIMKRKDGDLNHLEITSKLLSDGRLLSLVRDIAERKKAEEEIKLANDRFKLIAEATNDVIWDWDLVNNETWWNNNYYSVFGFEMNSPIHQDAWSNMIHPDDKKRVWDRLNKVLDSGNRYWDDEYRCINGEGKVVLIYDRGFVLYDENEKPYRMIGSMLDFTERKKAKEAIKASEEKYRTLVEQASDAILIADATGKLITVNKSACKLSQYTEEELMQMTIYDFIVEEELQKKALRFEELKQGKSTITEGLMKGKDGIPLDVEVTCKLLADGRLLSFVRDISERIKAQDEIIKEKNLSDSIINSLPGIFYMYNRYGKFLRWNTNFEKVSLYNAKEIRNMHPLDFFDPEEKDLITHKIENVFAKGKDEVQANFLLKNKEKIPYFFTGKAIDYEGERCLMGVGIDFSQNKKAQEEIKQTTEKLRELTGHLVKIREDERKRIGREIHDELGQQLTAIKMDVSWINKKLPEEPAVIKTKLKNVIGLLDSSNHSIKRILNELRPNILENHGFIESMEWLNRQFTKNTGIPVIFTSPEKEPKLSEPVITGIFRLYQEALNNITKHSQASNVISSLHIEGDLLIFTIEDNGQGFDPSAIQAKKSYGILGMKERTIFLGGIFGLESSAGFGTKITVSLPLTA